MVCNLEYIPSHLHLNDKPIVDIFNVGEKLFYRCFPQNLDRPYDKISLKDISHNRNFNDDENFGFENVFFNVIEDDENEKYVDYNHITLQINNLQGKSTYSKEIIKVNHLNETIKVIVILKHSPIACMYPHSSFVIIVNNIIVSDENYQETIGKDNKFYSRIRSEIRQELTSIIQTGEIDTSNEIEIIEFP